jgi:hypothetical protein
MSSGCCRRSCALDLRWQDSVTVSACGDSTQAQQNCLSRRPMTVSGLREIALTLVKLRSAVTRIPQIIHNNQ